MLPCRVFPPGDTQGMCLGFHKTWAVDYVKMQKNVLKLRKVTKNSTTRHKANRENDAVTKQNNEKRHI
jgi:hypothetical protein